MTVRFKDDTNGKEREFFENLIAGRDQLLKPEAKGYNILKILNKTICHWHYLDSFKPLRFSKLTIRYKCCDVIKLTETRETTQEVFS